jgi:hypothetical protein
VFFSSSIFVSEVGNPHYSETQGGQLKGRQDKDELKE